MNSASHQTIKLSQGKHASPDQGACVMELASMLAGEPFTDHPVSVSPVVASILRAYNDHAGDAQRQQLFEYASRTVGSRGTVALEQVRRERLNGWLMALGPRSRRLVPGWLRALAPKHSLDNAGAQLVKRSANQERGGRALALWIVDELLAIGEGPDWEAGTPDEACMPVPVATRAVEDS